MLKLSTILKILLVLGGGGAVVAAGWWIYTDILSLKKPAAPVINAVAVEGGCKGRFWYSDNSQSEQGLRFYRQALGEAGFSLLEEQAPHAGTPGSYDDPNLAMGTYEYQMSAYNAGGESFSNISDLVIIDDEDCDPAPASIIITAVAVEGNCKGRFWYADNFLNEDGLRIYRRNVGDASFVQIDAKGPHAGTPGSYDDPDLSNGNFEYQISAFDLQGEYFSNTSDPVVINSSYCDPAPALAENPQPGIKPTSTPAVCIWKAKINVFIRQGPGASSFPEISDAQADEELQVVGQSEDGQFWALQLQPGGVVGYVSKAEKFGLTAGGCGDVATLQDPEPPPAPVAPPVAPPSTPQCSDGIDNDGDRLIDLRDPGCSGPNDNSE